MRNKKLSTGKPVGRPRSSKSKATSFYLKDSTIEVLEEHCEATGTTKSMVAEKAFSDYFGYEYEAML